MNESCGCCEGVESATPVSNANRPGLSALIYRVGTHATFLETMLARLSGHLLPAPEVEGRKAEGIRPRPLLALRTREASDAAIAFLDAWATVADVLTFYQERIANEGYLRTATERRSVIELARLLDYRPRPGVAASAHLAYTLDDRAAVTIPAGSRAQSTPGPGELPQTFETAEDLYARAEWNLLQPRLTRPQSHLVRPASPSDALTRGGKPLYLKGTATNLKPNDPLLVDYDGRPGGQSLFRVTKVEADQAAGRTKVTLEPWVLIDAAPSVEVPVPTDSAPIQAATAIVERYRRAEDFGVNVNTAMARRALGHLDTLERNLHDDGDFKDMLLLLEQTLLPLLRKEHRLARESNFTKLEPWIGDMVAELQQLSRRLARLIAEREESNGSGSPSDTSAAAPPPLLGVFPLLKALSTQPSAPPRSKQQLAKNVADAFTPTSDNLLKLLGALRPGARSALSRALESAPVTPPVAAVVYALRTRASIFGHNAPLEQVRDGRGVLVRQREWTLFKSSDSESTIRRFRVNITYDNAGQNFHATVELLGDDEHATASSTKTLPLQDTQTPVSFSLSDETVTLAVSEISASEGQRATFTFQFQALKAEITIRRNNSEGAVSVSSTGSNPFRMDYDPATAPAQTFGASPSTTAIGFVSIASGSVPTEERNDVSLDASYNKILPGSWAVIEKKPLKLDTVTLLPSQPLITRIVDAGDGSRADYGMTATGTRLQLADAWIDPATEHFEDAIRKTTVFAENEPLELAEEPIDPVLEDVCGNQMELAMLADGLEAGRLMIVTGERTDIAPEPEAAPPVPPDAAPGSVTNAPATVASEGTQRAASNNGDAGVGGSQTKNIVSGVMAAELVMLSGVEHSYDPTLKGDRTHTTLQFASPLAYCYKRDTVRVYGNVVRATHGETRTEVLGSGDAGRAMQSFVLRQPPLTYVSAPTPSGIESTLRVRVNDVLWHETDTLAGLKPLDREYVTKTNDDGITTVVFGNGREGARLPTGNENIRAVYRAGIGKGGNLKAGQINQATSKPLGVNGVVNPSEATGGADRESRDEARRNAPLAVMALDRLVSARDYEDFARTFAGVAKASAVRLSDGRRQVVHLTIAGADDIPISKNSDLYKNLREALHKYGDPFQPIQVDARYLKTLVVSARVRVHPDYLWEAVEPKVRTTLLERFSFDRRDLGQDALLSEAIAAAQSVEGVVYVDVDVFDDIGESITPTDLLSLGEALGLQTRVRASLARIDTTALDPSARIRPAQLALLTPLVPDTLLLKEIKG